MKKILLIGKGGQLSENLIELLMADESFEFLALGHDELDLNRPHDVLKKLTSLNLRPDVIINAAAYTAVDAAEDEREMCNNINNVSVAELAKFAAQNNSLLVHYSTDYVFNGSGDKPFTESDTQNLQPVNYYGETKLAGERAVTQSGCKHLILRTSWVYNHTGKNFVLTMLKLAAERDELKVVSDQIGSPTYAYDMANLTLQLLKKYNGQQGIYHFVPQQQISWYDFTNAILAEATSHGFPVKVKNVVPLTTAQYPTKAARPLNSRLSTALLQQHFGLQFPPLQQSLTACLKRIKADN